MKLPIQSTNIMRHASVHSMTGQAVYPAQVVQIPRTSVILNRPGTSHAAIPDHSLFDLMLRGCTCISPNCVALECPACVVDGTCSSVNFPLTLANP